MDLVFRRLAPADASAYREVRLESLLKEPQAFGSSYSDEVQKPRLAFEEYILAQTPGRFMTGAWDGERLVAICGFFQFTGNDSRCGELLQLYVNSGYRGRGIASRLLRLGLQEAFALPEIEAVVIGGVVENTAALALYGKTGFVASGPPQPFSRADGSGGMEARLRIRREEFERPA